MGHKILIIEDNMLNLELATDLLETNGFIVCAAQTAEEGLRVAQQMTPDLVLMDLGLPGMDGLAATKKLKASASTRHLIVVGITAHAMKGDREIALKAGFDDYVTKPIDTRTFIESVKRFLALASSPETIPNEE